MKASLCHSSLYLLRKLNYFSQFAVLRDPAKLLNPNANQKSTDLSGAGMPVSFGGGVSFGVGAPGLSNDSGPNNGGQPNVTMTT